MQSKCWQGLLEAQWGHGYSKSFNFFQVIFHSGITLLVLTIAAITTAGYAASCNNLRPQVM